LSAGQKSNLTTLAVRRRTIIAESGVFQSTHAVKRTADNDRFAMELSCDAEPRQRNFIVRQRTRMTANGVMTEPVVIAGLLRQQAALANFGTFAFSEPELGKILTEAARVCAECLRAPFAKICRYRREQKDLLIVAGCGWRAGVIGIVISKADESSTQGRAFVTGKPVILEDVSQNGSLTLPPFYAEHKIVSTADVLIKGKTGPWGVLEVDSADRHEFNEHDVVFLTGFANVVAEAVAMAERTAAMQGAIESMKHLIVEKDALLGERAGRERKVHELQMELSHLSRLNAMGQMTAAIAHELNQPLAAITNYIGVAKLSLEVKQIDSGAILRLKALIGKIQSQTLRAGSIIKNLKDVVEKRESCRFEVNIEDVVRDSLAMVLYDVTDSNIALNFEFDSAISKVMIDKVQIQQILINLIRNSVEAMHGTKERTLTLTTLPGDAGFANVMVRDTGPGVLPNIAQRLFLPFNTTKASGMGLGLMVCQTLAEANGGRIWHVEDKEKGTCFCLSLPLAQPHAGESHSAAG
jgi:signal transduction histidine kinase